jgi:hypothetical protein
LPWATFKNSPRLQKQHEAEYRLIFKKRLEYVPKAILQELIELIKLNINPIKGHFADLVEELERSYKRIRNIELPHLIRNCKPSILSAHNSESTSLWVAQIDSFKSEKAKRKAAATEVINKFINQFVIFPRLIFQYFQKPILHILVKRILPENV